MTAFPFVMMHNRGCGRPAFLVRREIQWGEAARSEDAAHLDGRPVMPMDRVVCDSCGEPMGVPRTTDIFPLSVVAFE